MINKDYKENKQNVLKIYDEFKNFCNEYKYPLDKSIENQAEKIKNEVFNLMVLGEAKSGKSTFINAYLGKEVLPMHVLQCTSAIIEIKKGNKFFLTAKKAGGSQITKNSESEIIDFLQKHAAIQDEYRKIPVSTINNDLILPSEGHVTERDVDSFIANPNTLKNNIYALPAEEYYGLIRKYISEIKLQWHDIITHILIEYPLPDAMKDIRLIDSPGVGAGGNVGKIAENYINNANAIIFVKALTGQALESSSFRDFFNTNCQKKNKSALFLVFSRTAELSKKEFVDLKKQAIEMYEHNVQKERILFVDSKTQLFLNKCQTLGSKDLIREFFKDLKENGESYAPVSSAWGDSEGNVSEFFDSLEELSRFSSVSDGFERFAHQAGYIQLESLLNAISKDYEGKSAAINKIIRELHDKLDITPEQLAEQIKVKKNEINDVHSKIVESLSSIRYKYADIINEDSVIKNESKKKGDEYKTILNRFINLTEAQITEKGFEAISNELRIKTLDSIDDTKVFQKEMGKKLIKDCDKILIRIGETQDSIPMAAYAPNFTENDFDELNQNAKNQSSGETRHTEGALCFKKSWTEHYHHKQEHIAIIAQSISAKLESDIIPKMRDSAVEYADNLLEAYKRKLVEKGSDLKRQYEELLCKLKNAQDNEILLKEYQQCQEKISSNKEIVSAEYLEILNYVTKSR